MSTQYQLDITMEQDTLNALMQNNAYLYGLLGVQGEGMGGLPLTWYQTREYSLTTRLAWSADYQAYTSRMWVSPGMTIVPGAAYDITPGQQLTVTSSAGTGQVSSGSGSQIGIINQTSYQFTGGTAQQQPGGGFGLVCGFFLDPSGRLAVVPTGKVFLMFTPLDLGTGTALAESYNWGILLDMASSPVQSVSYEANTGWSCSGANCKTFPPKVPLPALLIQ